MSAQNSLLESLFPSSYPDHVYNFAYGSNMHPNIVSGRRKLQPIESIPGVLEGWQLTFDLRGVPPVEPCFGNITENPESEIHGVLHKLTRNDFKRLLATEGGSGVDVKGYIPTKVNVHAYDGRMIDAYALVVHRSSTYIFNQHALPSARYMGLLRGGAIHYKIHPLYIEYLQSLPSIERTKPMIIITILEVLSLTLLFSPIWIPTVGYYLCTKQKPKARAFFFTLIMTNVWRIYRFFGASSTIRPYYSAPFPLGSTDFKENSKSFRTEVQIDEQTLQKTESECPAEPDLSSPLLPTVKQRKSHPDLNAANQQE